MHAVILVPKLDPLYPEGRVPRERAIILARIAAARRVRRKRRLLRLGLGALRQRLRAHRAMRGRRRVEEAPVQRSLT